ncbi:hypothetical protein BaRGS_00029208 [Batillaria attramentaria]|uniref:Uncharacterized protein n=1 Tax=Batillaria attramentaria TaxID=370345 RepID=A0ABD0JWY9_9CAEN
MLRTALWKVMAAMASGLMTLRGVGSFSIEFDVKECMKRKEIGFREGNFYECPSPAYSDCCERDGQFTCCEPLVNKTILYFLIRSFPQRPKIVRSVWAVERSSHWWGRVVVQTYTDRQWVEDFRMTRLSRQVKPARMKRAQLTSVGEPSTARAQPGSGEM